VRVLFGRGGRSRLQGTLKQTCHSPLQAAQSLHV
jgi:hypothetical protein